MSETNHRDRSRADRGRKFKQVQKHTTPPDDQGGWMFVSASFMESPAYRSLSFNAHKALDRLRLEHVSHGRCLNGRLIVTHNDFINYGVTAEYVGDALDELAFKGLLRITRGRAGNGTAHPNIYRLTFDGDAEGAKATNEWKRITFDDAKLWSETVREERRAFRANVGRKTKTPLRVSEIRPLRFSEIRRAS